MSHRLQGRLRAAAVLAVLTTFIVALSLPSAGGAAPPGCANRTNTTYQTLLECVTLEGVRAHQAAFQAIADANGGTRAAGTPGYDASVEYVIEQLEDAGLSVETHQFDFTVTQPIMQLTPAPATTHPSGRITGSPLGTETDAVVAVDINLTPP